VRIYKDEHFDFIGLEYFLKFLEVDNKVKQSILILFSLKLIFDYFSFLYVESE